MVLLCHGLSHELLVSALDRVEEEELNLPINSVAVNNQVQSIYVLKIKLCCDSCNQKLRKILKLNGLETVSMDADEVLIKVKGTVDITAVAACIKYELKKNVDDIFPAKKDHDTAYEKEKDVTLRRKKERKTEGEATNTKDQVTAYKKEKDAGIPRKKDRRNTEGEEAKNNKDKGCNAAFNGKNRGPVTLDRKFKGTTAVFVRREGIAAFNMKDKGRNAAFDGKNRRIVPVDEKFEGTTAVYEKSEGIAAVYVKDKGTKEADEKLKGSSTAVDKHKDYAVNDEKDKGGIKDAETFGGAHVGRGECYGGKYSEDCGAMRRENAWACLSYDEMSPNLKVNHNCDNNWPFILSDENTQSCNIL